MVLSFHIFDDYQNPLDDVVTLLKYVKYVNGKDHKLRCGELASLWKATDRSILTDENMDLEGLQLRVCGVRLGRFQLSIRCTGRI